MKVFAFTYHLSDSPESSPGKDTILFWPDSCVLPSNRPLFIPDFANDFAVVSAIAVKLSRLGKCISRKFASRYCGEWAPASLLFPAYALNSLKAGMIVSPDNYCFDNAVVIGKWSPLPADGNVVCHASFRNHDGVNVAEEVVDIPLDYIYDDISAASRHNMLKMGDILLIPVRNSGLSPHENYSLSVTSVGSVEPLLFTKFK